MTYGVTRLDKGTTFNDDFHVFGLYWDETQMVSRRLRNGAVFRLSWARLFLFRLLVCCVAWEGSEKGKERRAGGSGRGMAWAVGSP